MREILSHGSGKQAHLLLTRLDLDRIRTFLPEDHILTLGLLMSLFYDCTLIWSFVKCDWLTVTCSSEMSYRKWKESWGRGRESSSVPQVTVDLWAIRSINTWRPRIQEKIGWELINRTISSIHPTANYPFNNVVFFIVVIKWASIS